MVFALNLIVPLFLGWHVTGPDGRTGMFVAVLVLLAIGLWICAIARQIGFALVVGGFAVALSQVCPILQMMAGLLSFAFSEATGVVSPVDGIANDGFPEVETIVAGFVMTMTAGGLLAAAALVAGLAIRAVFALRRW